MDEKKPPKPSKAEPPVAPTKSDGEPPLASRTSDMSLERLERGFQTCGPHPETRICNSRADCKYKAQLDQEARERARLRDR